MSASAPTSIGAVPVAARGTLHYLQLIKDNMITAFVPHRDLTVAAAEHTDVPERARLLAIFLATGDLNPTMSREVDQSLENISGMLLWTNNPHYCLRDPLANREWMSPVTIDKLHVPASAYKADESQCTFGGQTLEGALSLGWGLLHEESGKIGAVDIRQNDIRCTEATRYFLSTTEGPALEAVHQRLAELFRGPRSTTD